MNQAKLRKCSVQLIWELTSRILVAFAAFQIQRFLEPTTAAAISPIIMVDASVTQVPLTIGFPSSRNIFRPFLIGREDFHALDQFSLQ